MTLAKGDTDTAYTIQRIDAIQDDMRDFLFTLGCYPGERITIISKLTGNFIVNIKDARYSIDETLAKAIIV